MRKLLLIVVIAFSLTTSNLFACFGTELIIGYNNNDKESRYVAELLELYVKEKTGIDAKLLPLTDANLNLIAQEKVDVIVYPLNAIKDVTKMKLVKDGKLFYYYRTKIKEDLRFSTLEDAFLLLSLKLRYADIKELFSKLDKTGKVKRGIKEFLIEKGVW